MTTDTDKKGHVTNIDGNVPKEYVAVSELDMNNIELKDMKVSADGMTCNSQEREEKLERDPPPIGPLEIFRFADYKDVLLMILGTVASLAHGVALPSMIIVFSEVINAFVESAHEIMSPLKPHNISIEKDCKLDPPVYYSLTCDLVDSMKTFAIYFTIIGCAVIVCGYTQEACYGISSERQAIRIRLAFFRNIMRQNIGWFDTHDSGQLNTRISDDINTIRDGIGDKVSSVLQFLSQFITAVIIAFCYGWKLSLVILAASPALAIAALVMILRVANLTKKKKVPTATLR